MAWGGPSTVTFLGFHSTAGSPQGSVIQEEEDGLRFMGFMRTFLFLPLVPSGILLNLNPVGQGLVFVNRLGVIGMGMSRGEGLQPLV